MSHIEDAFNEICRKAKPPKSRYVSLYVKVPFYGGPEEGGWWGEDVHLVSSQQFPTKQAAETAKKKIELLCKKLNETAKREYGEQCRRESDWLDERGLDDSFLREPDGAETHFVVLERRQGSRIRQADRYYS